MMNGVRDATPADAANLALFADAAARGLNQWVWSVSAETGQSSFEVGRSAIRTDPDSLYYFARWSVVERNGEPAGGLNSYLVVPTAEVEDPEIGPVLLPIVELKRVAEGTWYISVASVFPEHRGTGVGRAVLETAETQARAARADRLTLIVASFNQNALRVYERFGFRELERRVFVPFPGSDPEGDWLLMIKDLA